MCICACVRACVCVVITNSNNSFFVVYRYFGSSYIFPSDCASGSKKNLFIFLRCLFQLLGKNGIVNKIDDDDDVLVEFHEADK